MVVFENASECNDQSPPSRDSGPDTGPDLALISDSALKRKSKCCNESPSVIRLFNSIGNVNDGFVFDAIGRL